MSGTYGRRSSEPFATWDPGSSSWRTSQATLTEGFQRYSDRWPRSGTTRDGRAYRLHTSARRIVANDFSPSPGLLPTPEASDGSGGRVSSDLGGSRPSGSKRAVTLATRVAHTLLPTPTATPYGNNPSPSVGAAVRPSLDSLAPMLLPTPRATDGTKGGPNQRGSSGDLMLPSAVQLLPTPTAMDSRSSGGRRPSDITLTDAIVRGKRLPGDPTSLPSDDGNEPLGE